MEKPRIINRWLIRVSFNSLPASPNPCGGTTALKEGVRGWASRPARNGKGGAGPPSLLACFVRFAHGKMVGGGGLIHLLISHGGILVRYYGALHFERTMKSLASKKTDWVRIAFILKVHGQLTPNQISATFSQAWPSRSRSSREVAQILTSYRKKGFYLVAKYSKGNDHFTIWHFDEQLPEIPTSTLKRWKTQLIPYGDEWLNYVQTLIL